MTNLIGGGMTPPYKLVDYRTTYFPHFFENNI